MIDQAAGILEIDEMLPAGGQGIIGATLRLDATEWLKELAAKLDNKEARLAALAERAFLRKLDGSCRTPIAAHFRLTHEGAEMTGEVLADDGSRRWRAEGIIEGRPSVFDAEVLGNALAEDVAAERAHELEGAPWPDDGEQDDEIDA
jgi:hydroxymethylbilane synthase